MTGSERGAEAPRLDELLEHLRDLGREREADCARGGPLLAAFGDWCHQVGAQPGVALFEVWLKEVHHPNPVSATAVSKAREALADAREALADG